MVGAAARHRPPASSSIVSDSVFILFDFNETKGWDMQKEGRRHDPLEDACAVLELYLRFIYGRPEYMTDDELLKYHVDQLQG